MQPHLRRLFFILLILCIPKEARLADTISPLPELIRFSQYIFAVKKAEPHRTVKNLPGGIVRSTFRYTLAETIYGSDTQKTGSIINVIEDNNPTLRRSGLVYRPGLDYRKANTLILFLIRLPGTDNYLFALPNAYELLSKKKEIIDLASAIKTRRTDSIISEQKAMQLANDYLKSINIEWGKPVSVSVVHQSSAILVKGRDGQMHQETWDSVYYVQYPTEKRERELTGIKTVVVTRDGLKVAIPNVE
jgi:hypothetical protein